MDRISPEQTSARMRAVGRRDTPAEVRLRRALWRLGYRYRTHRRIGTTKPDIVFGPHRVAVFVDGCFWHGCPRHYLAPVNNAEFWRKRITTNQARDRRNDAELTDAGWRVLRFWECDITKRFDDIVQAVSSSLH